MEKEKKSYVRLDGEVLQNLIREFVKEKNGDEFTTRDLMSCFSKFKWFAQLNPKSQEGRAYHLVVKCKEMYGSGFKTIRRGRHISYKVVLEAPEEAVPDVAKTGDTELMRKLYLVVKRASELKVGISMRDIKNIMGVRRKTSKSLLDDEINSILEKETGYRPLMRKESRFVKNYEVFVANSDIAELVLQDLREKIDGSEPMMPVFEDFESFVKKIVKNDYETLKMFEKSTTLYYRDGDLKRFRDAVLGKKTISIGIQKVAETFEGILKRRYDIDLDFVGKSRNYVSVIDDLERTKTRDALIRIEEVYAEYFCEDIIERRETVREKEIARAKEPNEDEKSMLQVIEGIIFKETKGMFLSDIWKKFDTLKIPRGWDLLSLLRKNPDKFKIEVKTNSGKYTEDFVSYIYTQPEPEPIVVDEKIKDEEQEQEVSKEANTLMAIFGTKDKENMPSEILNPKPRGTFGLEGEYYLYDISVGLDDKLAILEYLKLTWMSGSTIIVEGGTIKWEYKLRKMLTD